MVFKSKEKSLISDLSRYSFLGIIKRSLDFERFRVEYKVDLKSAEKLFYSKI